MSPSCWTIMKILVICLLIVATEGARKKGGKRTQPEMSEEAEPDDVDERIEIEENENPDDGNDANVGGDKDEVVEREAEGQGQLCDASHIPVAEMYLMTEHVENFFEGHVSTDEVQRSLKEITIGGGEKTCREAFDSLKNLTVGLLDEEEDTNAMLVYKSLIRILNERLGELLELQKQINVTKMLDSPVEETILLVKYEIASGEVEDAAEHFQHLVSFGVSIADVIDRVYQIEYLENILLFLSTISIDYLLEGTLALYDYLINDYALSPLTALLFDEYLERFSSLKGATAVVFIFNGMRYKLQEEMDRVHATNLDRASLIAVEIQKGDTLSAIEKFFEFNEPNIMDIVRFSFVENAMSSLTEFLDEFEDAQKVQAGLALLELMLEKEGTHEYYSDEAVFYEFLLRSISAAEDLVAQLLYDGIIRQLIKKYPGLESLKDSPPMTPGIDPLPGPQPALPGTLIMIKPIINKSREYQNFISHSQYESSKSTNWFEKTSPDRQCFFFDGRGSRLEGNGMMPFSSSRGWQISFDFKTVKRDGLLIAVENDPYNFGIFLRHGRVCVAHPSLMCSSERHTYDDNLWHEATVNYHGNGLLEVAVDRTALDTGMPSVSERKVQTEPKKMYLSKKLRKIPVGQRGMTSAPKAGKKITKRTKDAIQKKEKKSVLEKFKTRLDNRMAKNNTKSKARKPEKLSPHDKSKSTQDLSEIARQIYNGENIRRNDGKASNHARADEILSKIRQKMDEKGAQKNSDGYGHRSKREGMKTNGTQRMMEPDTMEMPEGFRLPKAAAVRNVIFVGNLPYQRYSDFYGLDGAGSFEGEMKGLRVNQMPFIVSKQDGTEHCFSLGRRKNG